MSGQHRGTYQYWKPNRRWSWAKCERVAWFVGLYLALAVSGYAMITTLALLVNLPPEIPQ